MTLKQTRQLKKIVSKIFFLLRAVNGSNNSIANYLLVIKNIERYGEAVNLKQIRVFILIQNL